MRWNKTLRLPGIVASALVLAATWGASLPAQAARVMATTGTLQLQRGEAVLPVVVGTRLREGDAVLSAPGAEVVVRFDDGARMALRASSTLHITALQLSGPRSKRQKTLRIVKGGLRYISSQVSARHRVVFETNTATIGIRGTDIEIAVASEAVDEDPSGTYLKVNTGAATLTAVDGTVVALDPGQVAFGGEPDLVPRGAGGTRRPAGRKVESASGLFKAGLLDTLMR